MTLKLCGFSASNYYNKIKLQLLEKEVPFVEELVWTGHAEAQLVERSPMAKVPFLDTPSGPMSESIACAEYIEATYPQKPLLPADPYAAAKVRELLRYIELDLELVARNGVSAWLRQGVQAGERVLVYPPAAVVDGARVAPRVAAP